MRLNDVIPDHFKEIRPEEAQLGDLLMTWGTSDSLNYLEMYKLEKVAKNGSVRCRNLLNGRIQWVSNMRGNIRHVYRNEYIPLFIEEGDDEF